MNARRLVYILMLVPALIILVGLNIDVVRDGAVSEPVERFGFIRSVGTGGESIEFDSAEWLTGDEARREFESKGMCDPGSDCEPPNGYIIRNDDTSTTRVPVSKSAVFVMQTRSHDPDGNLNFNESVTLEEFTNALQSGPYALYVPFHVTIERGAVVKIIEQYVP